MSFLPIEKVRGEHLVDQTNLVAVLAGVALAPPQPIIEHAAAPVEAITLHMIDGQPVAEVATGKGVKLFDAVTGAMLPPVDAEAATKIGKAAWKSDIKPSSVMTIVKSESTEYCASLPASRIAFADADETSIFVTADTGRVTDVRTGTWRLYDFFWGLHIMDWKNQENFDSWWLLAFAIGGLLLGIAGTFMLFIRWLFKRRRSATNHFL